MWFLSVWWLKCLNFVAGVRLKFVYVFFFTLPCCICVCISMDYCKRIEIIYVIFLFVCFVCECVLLVCISKLAKKKMFKIVACDNIKVTKRYPWYTRFTRLIFVDIYFWMIHGFVRAFDWYLNASFPIQFGSGPVNFIYFINSWSQHKNIILFDDFFETVRLWL